MMYRIIFNDGEEVIKELTEQQLDALNKKAMNKELVIINGESYNMAYLKRIKKMPTSYDKLSIEQKESLKKLQERYPDDKEQIETINHEGLERFKKLKTKLLK